VTRLSYRVGYEEVAPSRWRGFVLGPNNERLIACAHAHRTQVAAKACARALKEQEIEDAQVRADVAALNDGRRR
jgi:hypothetical protein